MLKRLALILALGATLFACTPSGGGATTGPTVAPPASEMPSESMPAESAAPSAS